MTYEFKHLLPDDFAPTAKVWIYQASRPFLLSEALELEVMLQQFVQTWKSHGDAVKGYANLFFGQFIILIADDSVSGCSTDSSVHVIKDAERRFGVSLFDRQTLAFIVKDKIQIVPLSQMEYAIKQGFIDGDTIYFNNIVSSKAEMENGWLLPIKDSWLAKRYMYA